MRGRIWLSYFFKSIRLANEPPPGCSEREWTRFYQDVMSLIATKSKSYVAMRRANAGAESGKTEYLNIDALFLDLAEFGFSEREKDWDPFVLPRAVVEIEHSYDRNRIAYCLWKILCVRAPVRVLLCCQKGRERVEALARYLEDVVWRGSLMKGTDSDLLVLIGDDSHGEDSSWEEYYSVHEWRNDSLQSLRQEKGEL